METIGAYEAKTHLPRLLEEVAAGKTFVITRHGVPVARLGPADGRPADPSETIRALREARVGVKLGGLKMKKLIEQGRR
jgi:prevent-host-death family protein